VTYFSKLFCTMSATNLLSSQHCVILPRASPAAQRRRGLELASISWEHTGGLTIKYRGGSYYYTQGGGGCTNT